MTLYELRLRMPEFEKTGYCYIEDFLKENNIPYKFSGFSDTIEESNAEKALTIYSRLIADICSEDSSVNTTPKMEAEKTTSILHGNQYQYVVLQVTLKEKFLGTGSANLTELETVINQQAKKGYRLHTISTTSGGSKGFGGGDRIQATMVFEKII